MTKTNCDVCGEMPAYYPREELRREQDRVAKKLMRAHEKVRRLTDEWRRISDQIDAEMPDDVRRALRAYTKARSFVKAPRK